ncbi:MAG TPA: periplasmic heavy metal sensor, partial [Rhodopila sp.]
MVDPRRRAGLGWWRGRRFAAVVLICYPLCSFRGTSRMRPQVIAAAVFFCGLTGTPLKGAAWAADPAPMPEAGQKALPEAGRRAASIKAFSDADVAALRNGDDMGMTKVAALNGYPGPAEVLALGDKLGLTNTQRQQVTASLDHMTDAAKPLGIDLIAHEQALDRLFAAETITPEALAEEMAAIGILQGRLRLVHLAAYLETRASLSSEQLALYHEL